MWYDMVCFDMLWYSILAMVYSGMLQYGKLSCVAIAIENSGYGVVVVCYNKLQYVKVWHVIQWYAMVWYDLFIIIVCLKILIGLSQPCHAMEWYGMVWYSQVLKGLLWYL